MILTIALNPIVVRQMYMDGLQLDTMNYAVTDKLSVGDCGIYSAYVIKVMQGEPYVMGISGGIGGRYIKNYLDKNRIKTDFLQVDHETKTHLILNDTVNDTRSVIISHNDDISPRDYTNIKHKLHHHLDDCDVITISGNDHWSASLMKDIDNLSHGNHKVIVAVEGDALFKCLDERAYAVILDTDNLEAMGYAFPEDEESIERLHAFARAHSIHYLLVKGQYEIVGFSKNKVCKVHYHAKDSIYPIIKSMILGGLAIGVKRDYSFEKTMKLMGSIANNSSINDYPFVIRRKEIDRGLKHAKLYELFNSKQGFINGGSGNEGV